VNLLQFSSSGELRLKLINTGSDKLVYAGEETPLGIDYRCFRNSGWCDNENWLGEELMTVRDQLLKCSVTVFLLITLCTHAHTHNHFMALWILSGTTRVSRYQKKHSPTHTYHGHQSSLICPSLALCHHPCTCSAVRVYTKTCHSYHIPLHSVTVLLLCYLCS